MGHTRRQAAWNRLIATTELERPIIEEVRRRSARGTKKRSSNALRAPVLHKQDGRPHGAGHGPAARIWI